MTPFAYTESVQPRSLELAIQVAVSAEAELPGYASRLPEVATRPELSRDFLRRCRQIAGRLAVAMSGGGLVAMVAPTRGVDASAVAAGVAVGLAADPAVRVLLLDADFEAGEQSALFNLGAGPGLADWIEDRQPLRAVAGPGRNLVIAGSGARRGSSEWLHRELANRLAEHPPGSFDWIVVDGPPLLAASSYSAILTVADGYLLVGRYHSTTFQELRQAAEQLPPSRPAGFVLTGDASRIPGWLERIL